MVKIEEFLTLKLNREEWEHVLAACEEMSCQHNRTDFMTHCCDLNEIVPKIRGLLHVVATGDERESSKDKEDDN